MDVIDLEGWLTAAKDGMALLKAAAAVLPKGEKRAEIESKLDAAASAMARSDAKLAKELGGKLCDCTFPPQIMLWKESQKAHVCPNPACGKVQTRGMNISSGAVAESARGPNSWMGR
jgi:hypothetical protein